MSLYTRKQGEYVALTKEQYRRLRRVEPVAALRLACAEAVPLLNATGHYLLHNEKPRLAAQFFNKATALRKAGQNV